MFADEADQDAQDKQYFVLGAIYVPASSAKELVKFIKKIRTDNGFETHHLFKFSPGSIPKGIHRDHHAAMKEALLTKAVKNGVKATCYLLPHGIGKGRDKPKKLKYAVNSVLYNFDGKFLPTTESKSGLAFLDSTTDYKQQSYFKELMTVGLPFENKEQKVIKRVPLKHTLGIHITQPSMCHLNSLCDIVVGSFRFVFNEPDKDRIGSLLFKQLSGFLWGPIKITENGPVKVVNENSLIFRPKDRSDYAEADRQATMEMLKKYLTL